MVQQKLAAAKIKGLSDTEAAMQAGYGAGYARGHGGELVRNPNVQKLIAENNEKIKAAGIADAKQIREFWTEIMLDTKNLYSERLKASEYLAKAMGMFTQNINIAGSVPVTIIEDISGK